MDAIGQIIYGGTSGAPTKLAAGSAGQMLVSGGAGAPSWTDGVTYDAGILTVGTGSQLFTFLSNGNFGIGNTEPAYPLDVNGDVNIATGSHFKINGTNLASSDIGAQDLSATLSSISGLSDSAGVLTNDGEGNLTWSAGGGGGGMSNPMDAIGQIIYGGTSGAPTKLAAGSSGQILVSGGGAAPVWSTATYPSTTTENQILFSTSNNVIGASTGLTYDDTTGMTVGSSDEIFTVLSNGNVGIGNTTPAYPLDIVSSTSVPQFAIENVATTKNTTFGVDSDGNLTITPIGGNATIAGTLTVGASNTTGTLATRVSTSVPTESDANGSIVINSGDYPGIYFRYGNSWQYAAEVGGFQIPKFENTDPISGEQIKEGDIVLGMINKAYADEGLHGIWVTWNSVKNELLAEIEAKGLDVTGALGTGEVSGVQTTTLADKVKNVLSTMGISIKDGVTNITKLAVKSFSADTATIKGLQMVDKSTGDIYCTWIENGEWQKAKGECGNIVPAALVTPETPGNETPAPVETPTQPPAEQPQQPQSQEPQASQTLNISSVASILDINIAFGTALASVGLPAVSTVTLSDSTTQSLLTVWDNGNPSYDANTAGTYVFSGTLSLPENITNTNNITASANVIIAPQPVQVETPVSDAVSETSEVIQNAAAGLMNGIVNFFKWIFGTVTQTISSVPAVQKVGTSLSQQTMSLSSGTAGLLQPIVKFLGW